MRLPLFSESPSVPTKAEAPWTTLVLVCSKCKGARRGPEARDIRKGLKRLLGKPKTLRILEVDCLDICPDDAVATCVVQRAGARVDLTLIQSDQAVEALARALAPDHGQR